jgi:hypothetical protein
MMIDMAEENIDGNCDGDDLIFVVNNVIKLSKKHRRRSILFYKYIIFQFTKSIQPPIHQSIFVN